MKKNRVGVIGVGNMGKNHARVYSKIANLVAVSDINEKLGREIATKYNAVFYKDYNEMLLGEKLDAVSVVAPTLMHKLIALDCLKNKIPTLIEKPIAINVNEAREIALAAKKHSTLLMVGHIERFNPAVTKLKELIDGGRLGKIISLLAIRVGIAPPNPSASDVALDLGIHDVDVFNYLLGKFPSKKKVLKTKLFSKNVADSSTIILEYEKVTAVIQTNWITPVKMRKLFVSGTEGYVEVDYIRQKLILHGKILDTRFDGSFYELISISNKAPIKEVYISKKEPLKEELSYFLSNIRNWEKNNADESIKSLEVVS